MHDELEAMEDEVDRLSRQVDRYEQAHDPLNEMLAEHEHTKMMEHIEELEHALKSNEGELRKLRCHGDEIIDENRLLIFQNQCLQEELDKLRADRSQVMSS